MDNILSLENISKRFTGVIALNNVSFNVKKGQILSIVGENGAGKSTLLKIISGVIPHNKFEGKICFDGNEVNFSNIKDSEKKGITVIHQELTYQPHLTLVENIFQGNYLSKMGITNWNKMNKLAKYYLELVGLNKNPNLKASHLSIAELQLVEIAKALSKNSKLLILDEPTSSLNDEDAFALLNIMKNLKKNGVTSIFVSHKLKEVAYVSDAITVIRDGGHISDYKNKGISESKLIKDIVGRELKNKFPKHIDKNIGEIIFEAKNFSVEHPKTKNMMIVKNSSFNVKRGEIVGISGLVGSGRSELALNIFGKSFGIRKEGNIFLHNKKVKIKSPYDAIKKKFMYVTEDRKEAGLIQEFSVHYNINSASLHIYSNMFGIINKNKEILNSNKRKYEVNIKVPNIDYKVETLSGGNQQKVLLAKALSTEFETIIIDEPTKGIDVGSKFEIYKIIQQLANDGKAVVVISSEIEELLGITDRIFVMSQGIIKDNILTKDATPEKIMQLAIGENKERRILKNEK